MAAITANRAIIKERFVAADEIDAKDLKCPNCGSKTYVLGGNSQVGRKEDWQDGQLVHAETDMNHVFELEQIEYLGCMTRSLIKPSEVMGLERNVRDLRESLIELTGQDPYGRGKPNESRQDRSRRVDWSQPAGGCMTPYSNLSIT